MTHPTQPTPPYPAGSLHAPLTTEQRNRVIGYWAHWAVVVGGQKDYATAVSNILSTIKAWGSGNQDDAIIEAYEGILVDYYKPPTVGGSPPVGQPGFGVLPGAIDAGKGVVHAITSVADFLQLLADPKLWVRVGEFIIGGLLIGVALDQALKGNAAYDKTASAVRSTAHKGGLLSASGHTKHVVPKPKVIP